MTIISHVRRQTVAYLALFFAMSGTGMAAKPLLTGKDIKNSSLTTADVKNSSLTTADVKNGSLRAKDFKSGELQTGPQGPQGPQGPKGDPGTIDTSNVYSKAESDRRLSRATSASGSTVFSTATFVSAGSIQVAAPASGRVLVAATPHFGMNTPAAATSGDCSIDFRLTDGSTSSEVVTIGIRPGTTSAQSDMSGALTHVFEAPSAGVVTVALQVRFNPGVTTGTCQTWAAFPVMSALWAPLGADG
jgi:hypothetical protein